MPKIIKIEDFSSPYVALYKSLTGPELRRSLEAENGVFIAESPTVIKVALGAGCRPLSLLTDERLLHGAALELINSYPDIPVFAASEELLRTMTGFALTRGILCAMERPTPLSAEKITKGARRVAVFENITDSTNIGALFRSAAAFDIDAVLLTPSCCDPLCRRAVRVSMGTVFQIPFARICDTPSEWESEGVKRLRELGFTTLAMALTDDSVSINDPRLKKEERLAVILGTEGDGLRPSTVKNADYTVKIPMSHGVDSLNVAAAGAVAFFCFSQRED
ncbi:MAG: RNA methyltransferase [Clostridia bacterium]|nr:RNA methyltransferase [Clostridia bacterium]